MTTPARFITAVLLAVGIFFAGYLANRQEDPSTASASGEQAVLYSCPMHPQYTSDHAGDCPICGMRLTLMTAGEVHTDSDHASPGHPGMVQVSASKQQLIGVRSDEVRHDSPSQLLRVPGRVTVDDQRLYRIVAAADGWIVDLKQNTVGTFVKKDQLLASYYTRDLLGTERLFLTSLGAVVDGPNRGEVSSPSIRVGVSLIPQYPVDSLRGLGMSDLQIDEVQRTRTAAPSVHIHSPVPGFILARNISPQQRFEKGAELFSIADISHVWVMTDVFEKDREFIQPGATATIDYRGRKYQGRMSDALPQFDPQSRTLKARFEVDNPGHALLPDAFVDVEIEAQKPAAITIPADAVIDSGRRKTVYVDRGNGVFEPRLVETGWRFGDRVQVTQGLEPGERIVVSGNFLIDSESRMRLPNAGSPAMAEQSQTAKDLVCGMEVDPKSPQTLKTEYKGKTYYFCSESCKKSFEANPGKYTPAAAATAVKDPVCGMDVDPESPHTLKTEYKGKTYYFCSESCKKSFEANPGKYTPAAAATTVKDPVCGMDVNPRSPQTLKREYKGKTYYFCAESCKKSFEADPGKYVPKMADRDLHGAHVTR